MNRSRCNLVRFDLHIPETTVEYIERKADELGMPPRTYGRVLLLEKVKELEGEV